MGFLKDIQDMRTSTTTATSATPSLSREFYNRFYRPEYTTIILWAM